MPATNFTPIQLYRTNTASTTAPSGANLNAGEIAINYNDGGMILFAKNTTGTVIKLMNNPADLLYPTADGTSNQAITTNGSKTLGFSSVALLGSANTFTAAQTFRAANAVRSEAASTQDAVVLAGRAGGTSSYAVTLTPTTLSSSTTLTLPNATDTVAVIGTAQTFTAAQTFRAANAIRSEAASTQDAVVLAGRAGGTSSYAVTLTPTTLTASQTLTLPNTTGTVSTTGFSIAMALVLGF